MSDAVEQQIVKLDLANAEAVLRSDVAALEKVWAEDFTVNNPNNQVLKGRKQVLGLVRSGLIKYSSFVREVESVLIHGDTAILMGLEIVKPIGKAPGAGQTIHRRFTNVWMNREGQWQLTARHASIICPVAAERQRAFNVGIQTGKLMTKPHIPMLKENNVRSGFFDREQFLALIWHLPEDLKPMIAFAYITGWRIRSEVQTLQWRQVDFEAGRVMLDPGTTKNSEGRVFPFTRELRLLLEKQRERSKELQRKKGTLCRGYSTEAEAALRPSAAPGRRLARKPASQEESRMTSGAPL